MNIFIIGQCTLHWGRMEFGNIGNYYIIEPLIRELHKTFPNAEIKTTFQMSERFCKDEKVKVLPMELYYGFNDGDYPTATKELEIARNFSLTGKLSETTPFIDEVMSSDLVIDFSGDIWGDNADFLGDNRFFVGLCKDRVAQLLGKKTVMLAGSPGPFDAEKNIEFAKEVFENFDLVTNREAVSRKVLEEQRFNLDNLHDLACPAFLFEPKTIDLQGISPRLAEKKKPVVGFILCGWNFLTAPFDKWPRPDEDYQVFADAVAGFLSKTDADICVMSHSNGFIPGKQPFELIHGRDYPIVKQLQKVLDEMGLSDRVFSLDGVYDTWTTKAIIAHFDMLVSGRIHAAVSGFSQHVPTVVIDYGHEPKAHKLHGFANEAGMRHFVADPAVKGELSAKMLECWNGRTNVRTELENKIPLVKEKARKNFQLLKSLA